MIEIGFLALKRTARRLYPSCMMIGIFLALFSVCYSSVLTNDYGFIDEYFDIMPDSNEIIVKKRIQEGRPLYAMIYGAITSGGMYIEDLRWFRFAGIAGLSLLAFSVFRVLVYVGWGRFQSFCVSGILCTTLPFQLYVAWATASIFIFGAFISGLALLLADRAVGVRKRREKLVLISGAILTLYAAIAIYQNAAMFFWVLAAIIMLKPEATLLDISRRLTWYGIVCAIGLFLGFMTYKVGDHFYSIASEVSEKGDLSQDVSGRIIFFFEILPVIINFAFLSPYHFFFSPSGIPHTYAYMREFDNNIVGDMIVAVVVFFAIMAGLWLYFRGSIRQRALKCVCALFLLPLSLVPLLVLDTNFFAYRMLSASASLVVLYAYFAFRGYISLRKSRAHVLENVSLAAAAYISVLLADYHVRNYVVIPQVEELEVMRFPLERQDIAQAERIHVIRPAPGPWETLAPLMWLEFGQTSSRYSWHVPSMVFLLLRDLSPSHMHKPVTSIPGSPGDTIEPPPGSLVVDMRNIFFRLQAYRWIGGEDVPGTLVHSSFFTVHMDENNLYYVKDSCSLQDTAPPFFLHVTPPHPESLPDHRKQYGWDNLNFDFVWHGVFYEDKCMAIVRRPDYVDAHVSTGQYIRRGNEIWKGEFRIKEGDVTP